MSFSIRAIIRGLLAPDHQLSVPSTLWRALLQALVERGHGSRESGAFLLGTVASGRRSVRSFVLYDDLDRRCLDTGIVIFDGAGFGPLWSRCRELGLSVVADVHTHGGEATQSEPDRKNPMIAQSGHCALILPHFAVGPISPDEIGFYRYRGGHTWENLGFEQCRRHLYIGRMG